MYSDRWSWCVVADWGHCRGFSMGLCVRRPFCLRHSGVQRVCECVIKQGAYERSSRPSACLFPFLSLIHCNVRLCGGEPGPRLALEWKMKHIHLLYAFRGFRLMPSAMIGSPYHWKHVSNRGAVLRPVSFLMSWWCISPEFVLCWVRRALLFKTAAHTHLVIVPLN